MVNTVQFDAFPGAKLASRMEEAGVARAGLKASSTLGLAALGGVFIALGSAFALAVTTGLEAAGMGYGIVKLLGGLAFCLGFVVSIVAGAEIFAGHNLTVMAFAGGRLPLAGLLRNWGLVYAGNLVGAVLIAVLLFSAGVGAFSGGAVGNHVLSIAGQRCSAGFFQALVLGLLGGLLIALTVWLCHSARTITDRILLIAFPITALAAIGLEYAIANLYVVPLALFLKPGLAGGAGDLTWSSFLFNNLLPVSLGNLLGGAGLLGLAYWLFRARPQRPAPEKPKAEEPHILVVDDDPDFVEVTTLILQKEGYKTLTAYNGKEAWASMLKSKPDMVLLDVMMSTTLEGVDLSRRMAADPRLQDVPIIMISSIDSTYHAGRLPDTVHLPIDAWLSKPVSPDLLLKTIRRHLRT